MKRQKSLNELLKDLSCRKVRGGIADDVLITGVETDSRRVEAGALFIALRGENSDGHNYINEAVAAGCSGLLVDKQHVDKADGVGEDVAVYVTEDTREVLADIIADFYDRPQKDLRLIAITGTNGKTTTAHLLEKILVDQGERVGVIGTVSYRLTAKDGTREEWPAPLTTPDPVLLQKTLSQMAQRGGTTVIMEVSSHALVQKRLPGIAFDVAAFTNLSHDHLDYHGSMEEYFQAKCRLFLEHLKPTGTAVVSYQQKDAVEGRRWSEALERLLRTNAVSMVQCGYGEQSIIRPVEVTAEAERTVVSFSTPQGQLDMVSPLVGRFNIDNMTTALAIASLLGVDMGMAAGSLAEVTGAPGRLERVDPSTEEAPGATVFVDFAHTPDALLNVLRTLKELPHERLICVFGCGGDRDNGKRPVMGKIVAEEADIAILTNDNPRSESPERILGHIVAGLHDGSMAENTVEWLLEADQKRGYVIIPDRREAIRRAVQAGSANDIVLIAGKGHEKYQLTQTGKRFFDDVREAREAMLSWDVPALEKALGVTAEGAPKKGFFNNICTDTRKLQANDLFLALRGENFDGHDYIDQAVAAGAGGVIIDAGTSRFAALPVPCFRVEDTLQALGDLACFRRRMLAAITSPVVIGITGSSGKTTVKEMVASIFETRWPDGDQVPEGRVLKTQGNFNNLVGLPLSLLPLEMKHKVAVMEMGMNTPGEIGRLTAIADPDISCIVNVHGAHLEGMGSIEGVAREKARLFSGTRTEGALVVNLDDDYVREAARNCDHKTVSFTTRDILRRDADVWAEHIRCGEDGAMSFTLHIGSETAAIDLRVPGRHNVANSLAAAAIAYAAGIGVEVVASGLTAFTATDKRLKVFKARDGYSILDDTYNANPESMKAGLETLALMQGGIKIAVLGDMLELGREAEEAHLNVGRYAGRMDLSFLLCFGDFGKQMAAGAVDAGMNAEKVIHFSDKESIVKWLQELAAGGKLPADAWVLCKASRGMRLESVVKGLSGPIHEPA